MDGGLIVVLVRIQNYNGTNGSFVRVHYNALSETLPFLFVSQFDCDFDDRLPVQRFVLSTRLQRHDFYTLDHGTVRFTALGA